MSKDDLPESNYLLDYDDSEKRRLQEQHELIKSYMGQLILAPVDLTQPGLKVLDSGTFDGFWLSEVSKDMNAPTLVGTDISSAAFPTEPPKGQEFHMQSVTGSWPEAWKGSFDIVHQRLVLAGTTPEGGREAVRGLMELAKPGMGVIQLIEGMLLTEAQQPEFPALYRFHSFIERMLPGFGWNIRVGLQIRDWLDSLGLVEVGQKILEIPVGKSNPDARLGKMAKKNLMDVMKVWRQASSRLPDDSKLQVSELEDILKDLEKEIESIGSLLRFNVVWGKRP